jgi:two-component system CheB/CheR fusion protein
MAANSGRSDGELEQLLEYLKGNRGFDFTGYKRASLARRMEKRMQELKIGAYADYVDYLEVHPEEFAVLFNTILINVTSFFRDESAWEYLAAEVLPEVVARKRNGPIRVWSAGCASGEEAYTLAMLFAELLGADAFREQVKVYGTDVDEDALARARQASYSERDVESIPASLRAKYFDRTDTTYTFKKDFRRQVIFGRHDLIQDAPISKVDVLACRNTLMYFNAETQARILARFHFALNDGGILFLGRAETMLTHAHTFTPLDIKRRISTKKPRATLELRDRLLLISQGGQDESGTGSGVNPTRLRELASDLSATSEIIVDAAGTLVSANERARGMFTLHRDDIGRPLQDLKVSYRPLELRSQLDRAGAERRPFQVRDVEWPMPSGETRWLEVQFVPIIDASSDLLGVSVSFSDVSAYKQAHLDLQRANRDLEAAYEEQQSTSEELETTTEELQSTIEELETTNEELQSTNEELETMNEELQSTNEELTTMNDELRVRGDELNQVNSFLESVLMSLRGGVAVLDSEMRVLIWNPRAEDLWGLREEEVVGKQFLALDIGLPVEQLKQPVKACLSGTKDFVELELDATNRRGRPVHVRVTCMPLAASTRALRGAIVVMEDLTGGGDGGRMRPGAGTEKVAG